MPQLSGCGQMYDCVIVADMLHRDIDTQFGALTLSEQDGAIVRLDWGVSGASDRSDVLDAACVQLAQYDAGDRTTFELPLRVGGSQVQQDVCAAMFAIPFGDTCTYGDIRQAIGNPCPSGRPSLRRQSNPDHHPLPQGHGGQGADGVFRCRRCRNQSRIAAARRCGQFPYLGEPDVDTRLCVFRVEKRPQISVVGTVAARRLQTLDRLM